MLKFIKKEIEYRNMKKELRYEKLDFTFKSLADSFIDAPIAALPKK